MKYKDAMFLGMEYIEKHIKDELTVQLIAQSVGYSAFHFSHIFKEQMGMAVMEYVKERRLICAAKEIFEGKKIIEVAIAYGYETHSGFTKAFKKKFGFPPTLIYMMQMSCSLLQEGSGIMESNKVENQSVFLKQTQDFTAPDVLYTNLVQIITSNGIACDLKKLEKVYQMANVAHQGGCRKSGEPYIIHPLCVAIILAEMQAEESAIIGGLLHEVREKNTIISLKRVSMECSPEIASLIEEVTRLTQVKLDDLKTEMDKVNPNSLLIKLADRLHNMRTIKYMEPDKLKEKAKETIEFFSPIATKLGISKIKVELDDLALKYL